MNPLLFLGIAVLVICAFCFVVASWADDTITVQPEPKPTPHQCRATVGGRHCGNTGYWLDQHADGSYMWTCDGCHEHGTRHGWLVAS